MVVCSLVFFFFKQKTAYEMRISDWSSDVCSSDLGEFGNDRGFIIRQHALDRVLEAFGRRDIDAGVARVARQVPWRAGFERRRRDVEAAAPDLHLIITVLRRGLGLVEPGEAAIVALVEPPVLGDRKSTRLNSCH